MATLTIEGRKVKVDDAFLSMPPEQQQQQVEEIASQLGVSAAAPEQPQTDPKVQEVGDQLARTSENFFNKNDGVARNLDSAVLGSKDMLTFGLDDEISGGIQSFLGAIDPFNDGDSYESNLRRERAFRTQREAMDPNATLTGKVLGGLASARALSSVNAPYMAALPAEASLAAKAAQSAKAGALYSGLYGFGTGTDPESRLSEAAKQAGTGALIGGAIPVVASGVKAVAKPVVDAVKARVNPGAYADQKIVERLSKAGVTTEQATAKMSRNPGLSLADSGGEPTRNLLRTAANIPGKAQQTIQTRLALRQMQQGDRIKSAIRQTLADPDGYLTAKDEIAETASRLARPLYEEAYRTPVPFTQSLESILETPAGRRALQQAEALAANEQQPFRQFFVNMTDETTGTIRRVPDARGWDYIKRGFDDVIQAEKAGTFGQTNNQARIITDLKNRMLREIDAANPAYREARRIWSSQAGMDDALEAGRIAIKQSPEATRRALADMSEAERQMFRVGMADAIRDRIGSSNVTHNALLKFFSSKDQLANLRAAFASDEQFAAFRQAMFAEARKRATYNKVTGNSTTAKQMADMMDAGGLQEGLTVAKNAATGGVVNATLQWVGSRLKMLGGLTPEVADQISRRLMSADPQTVQTITNQLMQIERQAISADQRRQLVQRIITPMLAERAQGLRQQ